MQQSPDGQQVSGFEYKKESFGAPPNTVKNNSEAPGVPRKTVDLNNVA